uniref:butyrophilin subfamily 1 member A1-like isoform X2 n=1 Tax=Scatophagus argus TaxID=75038 RepID=UPI001ED83539|nr:butyrophilin subfamily 1 member A1-like isoform X2 [Scatophagus argus]
MARLSLFVLLWTGMTSAGGAERVVVPEGDDAVLPCSLSTKEDLTRQDFLWRKDDQKEVFLYEEGQHSIGGRGSQDGQFKGRVSYFEDKLKNGDASIKIINTTVADRGTYTCVFPLHDRQTFLIELVVESVVKDRSGENTAAAPKPYITILDATKEGVRLQCEAEAASLRPAVWWQDSTEKILDAEEPQVSEKGGRYYVTLLITVTKSDHFSCVVAQREIHHQAAAQTFVPFYEDSSSKVLTGWLAGFFLGTAVLGAVLALLRCTKCITLNFNKGSCQQRKGSTASSADEPLNSLA